MQIVERIDWPEGNNAWPIGHYLEWRNTDYETIGPGGFAGYYATPSLTAAAFVETRKGANGIIAWMKKNFPRIACTIVSFQESATQETPRQIKQLCDHWGGCRAKKVTRVMISRSAYENARYANLCKRHAEDAKEFG